MNPAATATSAPLAVATLWRRELVRFFRDRGRVVGALGTPLVFWLLIGSGFDRVFRAPGDPDGGYLAYFFPGIVVLIVLFTAIFSTFSVIEDRQLGFLQGVLVAPVARTSIVLGKVLGGATLAVVQALAFIALAPTVGIPLTVGRVAAAAGILALVAVALTAFGFALAWRRASVQGFHSIMNLLLMPMWLLSGGVFPVETAPGWLRVCMLANPLTYGVSALRSVLEPASAGGAFPSMGVALGVTILFLFVCLWASARAVQRG
jgi:ABC-2 type transport system permease protein